MSEKKAKKKKKRPEERRPSKAGSLLDKMRERFASRDVRSARRLAFALVRSDEMTEEQKREARRLLEQTEIDQQAMWIGALALALALAYLAFFIL